MDDAVAIAKSSRGNDLGTRGGGLGLPRRGLAVMLVGALILRVACVTGIASTHPMSDNSSIECIAATGA